MASGPVYPLLTAKEFLEIDFGERKAELDNGVIRMIAGGRARHNRVAGNIQYKALPSVDTIVFVDIATERVWNVQRTGPNGWAENGYDEPFDVPLPSLGLTLPHAEMFARD